MELDPKLEQFMEWSQKDYERVQKQRKLPMIRVEIMALLEEVKREIASLEQELAQDQSHKPRVIVRNNPPYLRFSKHSTQLEMPFFIGTSQNGREIDKAGLLYPIWTPEQVELLQQLPLPSQSQTTNTGLKDMYYKRLSQVMSGIPRTPSELEAKHKQLHGVAQADDDPPPMTDSPKKSAPRWTKEQDDKLQFAVHLYRARKANWAPIVRTEVKENESKVAEAEGDIHWIAVSTVVGRTPRQCKYRYSKIKKNETWMIL